MGDVSSEIQENQASLSKLRFPNPEVEKEILKSLENLSFGSIEIIVHNSKVVQIERKEKIRFS